MVEGARLESVYGLTPIEGSNPSLSAKYKRGPFRASFIFAERKGESNPKGENPNAHGCAGATDRKS